MSAAKIKYKKKYDLTFFASPHIERNFLGIVFILCIVHKYTRDQQWNNKMNENDAVRFLCKFFTFFLI